MSGTNIRNNEKWFLTPFLPHLFFPDDLGSIVARANDGSIEFEPADDGVFTIEYTVTDQAGASDSDHATLTVHNVAPTSFLSGPQNVLQNQLLSLALSATDEGPLDQLAGFTYDIEFGDSTGTQIPRSSGNDVGVTVEHSYSSPGTYTVSVTATDWDGDVSAATSIIVNVEPSTPEELQDTIDQMLAGGDPAPVVEVLTSQETELDTWISAIEAIVIAPTSPPVEVTLDLSGNVYLGKNISVPEGVTVTIQNGTLTGSSPALIVNGNVLAENMVFTNSTAAPTIVVKSGNLTVRNSVVEESDVGRFAALKIKGGLVDLGQPGDLGGNTFRVQGTGEAIRNKNSEPVSALGNSFEIDGSIISSLYEIEDMIFHAFDTKSPQVGEVVYFSGNVAPQIEQLDSDHADLANRSSDGTVRIRGAFRDLAEGGTHTATVDWGDGSDIQQVRVNQNRFTFSEQHRYASGGVFTIAVTVLDDDGNSDSATTTAVVVGVGLIDNTLYVIGTDRKDSVLVTIGGPDGD